MVRNVSIGLSPFTTKTSNKPSSISALKAKRIRKLERGAVRGLDGGKDEQGKED